MRINSAQRAAAPKPTVRDLFLIVFWVACGLSTLALALSWVMVILAHFGVAPYNPLWLALAALLLLPSGGLWVGGWMLLHPGSPRR